MFQEILKHLKVLLFSWNVESYNIEQTEAEKIEMKILFKKRNT